jgi:hypothetical protein
MNSKIVKSKIVMLIEREKVEVSDADVSMGWML